LGSQLRDIESSLSQCRPSSPEERNLLDQRRILHLELSRRSVSPPIIRPLDLGIPSMDPAAFLYPKHAAMMRSALLGPTARPDTSELPLETTFGEIIAWRAWKVDGGRLTSPYQDTPWQPGEIMEGGDPFKDHGFYAHKRVEHLFAQERENWQVVGTVKLWGNVVEHTEGYRAEFALPHEFHIFHSTFSDSFKDWLKQEYTAAPSSCDSGGGRFLGGGIGSE